MLRITIGNPSTLVVDEAGRKNLMQALAEAGRPEVDKVVLGDPGVVLVITVERQEQKPNA